MRKLTIEIMVLIAIGMVLAFIGPFGTFELTLGKRLLYWTALVLVGFPLFRGCSMLARWLSDATQIPLTLSLLIAIGIGSIPMTVIVAMLFFRLAPSGMVDWSGIGLLYLQVWFLAALITGVTRLLFNAEPEAGATQPEDAQPRHETTGPSLSPEPPASEAPSAEEPRLDLPTGFGPVLALNSEDHYVRVIGEGRSELLLMRLRDAMALMPKHAGMQVHRSWWVASGAIATVGRSGRAMTITLTDGTIVPVSRDNQDKVKDVAFAR